MIMVDVVAVAAVLGMRPGDRRTVEDSPAVRAAIEGGKLRAVSTAHDGQGDGQGDGGPADSGGSTEDPPTPRPGRSRHPAGTRLPRQEVAEVAAAGAQGGPHGYASDSGGSVDRDGSGTGLGGAEGREDG